MDGRLARSSRLVHPVHGRRGSARRRTTAYGPTGRTGPHSLRPASPARRCAARRTGRPRWRSGRRGVPSSTTRPASSTSTRSAISTVESRWAMISAVRPRNTVRSARCTARSVGMSRLEVASSRISTAGSARKARAKAISCRWPADNRPPRLRTSVSKPAGSRRMNSSAPTARAACSISARDAPGRPKAMLSATEPENRKPSWVIITTAVCRSRSESSFSAMPSRRTWPSVGS